MKVWEFAAQDFKKRMSSFKSSPLANANFGLIYDET